MQSLECIIEASPIESARHKTSHMSASLLLVGRILSVFLLVWQADLTSISVPKKNQNSSNLKKIFLLLLGYFWATL